MMSFLGTSLSGGSGSNELKSMEINKPTLAMPNLLIL